MAPALGHVHLLVEALLRDAHLGAAGRWGDRGDIGVWGCHQVFEEHDGRHGVGGRANDVAGFEEAADKKIMIIRRNG